MSQSPLRDIMDETDSMQKLLSESDAYMSNAYQRFTRLMSEGADFPLGDPRLAEFLEEGYRAYVRQLVSRGQTDPSAHALCRVLRQMVGGGVSTRSSTRKEAEAGQRPAPVVTPVKTSRPAQQRVRTPPPGPSSERGGTPPPSPTPRASPSSPRTPPRSERAATPPPPTRPRKRKSDVKVSEEQDDGGGEEGEDTQRTPTITRLERQSCYLPAFKTTHLEEVFCLDNLEDTVLEGNVEIEGLFDTMLQAQRDEVGAKRGDWCSLSIRGSADQKAIWFHIRPNEQINGNIILTKLVNTLNSNEEFLAKKLTLHYVHIPRPEAAGHGGEVRGNESIESWISRYTSKTSGMIYDPSNRDQMCLARCIVVSMMKLSNMERREFHRNKKPNAVYRQARELCENAGVDPDSPCDMDDVVRFQTSLPNYRLIVYEGVRCKETLFAGPKSSGLDKRKNIYLLKHNAHFYAILSMTAVLCKSYFCEKCIKAYKNLPHRCLDSCWRCWSDVDHAEKADEQLLSCLDCHRKFFPGECMDTHKMNGVCDRAKMCTKCKKTFITEPGGEDKHKCNYVLCHYCKTRVPENHRCYMQPWEPPELAKNTRYIRIYFDIESSQETEHEKNKAWMKHKANLLVSQQVCGTCETQDNIHIPCGDCGVRQHVFHSFDDGSDSVMKQFFDHIRFLSSQKKTEFIIFAHNLKSFDGYFCIEHLIKEEKIKPEVILQGAKIIKLAFDNVVLKDSLMFLSQKLSSLPKSFDLHELKKGWFCHYFHKKENFNYVGKMPPSDTYCTSTMSVKEKQSFMTWYDEQVRNNYVFDFRKEIIDYCISDVNILREAMESFRRLFIEGAGFDPLRHCLTLSSACMANFRKNHLSTSAMGIVPRGGYRSRQRASYEALSWLDYESHKLGMQIQTSESMGEMKIFNKFVDGYVEIPKADGTIEKRIYQYHGCYWHLCLNCIPDEYSRALIRKGNECPYLRTQLTTELFRANGYTVIEKWGCEFKKDKQDDVDCKNYFNSHTFKRMVPLNLRDAICGGRTSALYTHMKANLEKGERIKFYDVCSEYPHCQYKMAYPEGHPDIFLENDPQMPPISHWNGVVRATVLPPTDLYLPVLPYKCNSKLLFPLCRSCAEQLYQGQCQHSDDDRCLTGTWCAPEVHLALSKKYKIITTHELYQYPRVRIYDRAKKQEGLFSTYVRENMTLKLEASGYPSHVKTEEEKDEYIRGHFIKDGIVIDKNKVKKNAGKRTLAKLILNSFWGKLGERTLRTSTTFVENYGELLALLQNKLIVVKSILPHGEKLLQVSHEPFEDMDDSTGTTSLVHAAFTTCHGRMLLYNYLDIVGERAAYHDTDSICFLSKPGHPDPPLGGFLGDLTDQLADDYGAGSFCTEFVSGGAKNYAYVVAVGGDLSNLKTVVKVRGISINSSCHDVVTFERLKEMVSNDKMKTIINIPSQISRTRDWDIISRPATKTWKVVLNKRRRIGDKTTAYGYAKQYEDVDFDEMDLDHITLDEDDCFDALADLMEN